MEYILMRHADDSGLNRTYSQIRDLAGSNGITLDHKGILERMVSLTIDPSDAYVHDEVIEIAKQREEELQELLKDYPDIVYEEENALAETAGRIKEMVSGKPLTIAYNDTLRTEFTANAVAKITGGNLVAGQLYKPSEVHQWMQDHAREEGITIIVTHEPAFGRYVEHSSAYYVGEVANLGRISQQI